MDDDPDVRAIVRRTGEGAGLTTAEAANGRAALDWLNSNPAPALILLDLMMPEVDGFEFPRGCEKTRICVKFLSSC